MTFRDDWDRWPHEDPGVVMPREVLGALDRELDDITFDGCRYFHGSRTLEPDRFIHEGLLSLADAIDSIWISLEGLVVDVCGADEWLAFRRWLESGVGGDSARLYRMRVADSIHHGPFTVLVREELLVPELLGHHDYLTIPEIVEDIAICFQERHGVDLAGRFEARSVPCIVTVEAGPPDGRCVGAALWYVYSMMRERRISAHAAWGLVPDGNSLPPSAIVGVETFAGSS